MVHREIVIPRVWRSQLGNVCLFAILSGFCVALSIRYPGTVITGPLFATEEHVYYLKLPLLWFIAVWPLCSAMYRIYNVRFSVDSRGIENRTGRLALKQSITRIRFEDIRSIETEQTLFERFLGIGLVEMGTAATAGLELVFDGIASPEAIQRMIQEERDVRLAKDIQDPETRDEAAEGVKVSGGE